MVLRIWSQRFKDRRDLRFSTAIFLINLINGDSLTREESNQIFFSNSFYQHYWGIFFLIRRFFDYWFNILNYSSTFFDYFEASLNHHRQIITIQSFFRFVIAKFSFKISILKEPILQRIQNRKDTRWSIKRIQKLVLCIVEAFDQGQKKKKNSRDTFDVSKINLGRTCSSFWSFKWSIIWTGWI